MNSPGDEAAVVGNGASGAVIRSQNVLGRQVDAGPERRPSPKVTNSGTMRDARRAAASAGSRSDAESVKIATRLKVASSSARPGRRCGHDTSRVQPGRLRRRAAMRASHAEPLRFAAMDRSLWAVLAGTFTLRFSTGPHRRDARRVPRRPCPSTAAGRSARSSSACSRATFYLAELVLSPIFGVLSDRLGHHRVMLYGPAFGAVAVILTGLTTNLARPRRDALAGGRVDRRERPVDPRLHRDGHGRQRAAPGQGVGPLRGRDPARAGRRVRRGAAPVRGPRAGRVLPQRPVLRRVVPDLPDGRGPGPARRRAVAATARRLRAATSSCCGAPTSGCSPRPGSRSTRRSACGSASRSSSSPRPNPRFPDQVLMRASRRSRSRSRRSSSAILFGAGLLYWGNRFKDLRRTTIILYGILGGGALVGAAASSSTTAAGSPLVARPRRDRRRRRSGCSCWPARRRPRWACWPTSRSGSPTTAARSWACTRCSSPSARSSAPSSAGSPPRRGIDGMLIATFGLLAVALVPLARSAPRRGRRLLAGEPR